MKKFLKVVDSSGVTHQFAATGIAAVYQNAGNRIEVEYTNGSQFVMPGIVSSDVATLPNAIFAINESKWTSVVDTVNFSTAPSAFSFTF